VFGRRIDGLVLDLDATIDEFTFRFNRRSSRSRGLLFHRLLQQAAHTDPHPLAGLVAAPVTDRGCHGVEVSPLRL
jgi:hypothetical protein